MKLLHLWLLTTSRALSPSSSKQQKNRRALLSSIGGLTVATHSLSSARAAEISLQKDMAVREFVSGLAGGAAQRIAKDVVLHPIDTVKTRLQRAGSRQLTRRVLLDPYAGVLGPLVVGVPAGAVFFGVKDATQAVVPAGTNEALAEALVVAVANAPYWMLRSPAELVKVRQQLDSTDKNGLVLARDIVREDGVQGLYRGALASYAYALPTDVVKFLVYRELKAQQKINFSANKVLNKAAFGSIASATAQLTTTPLDVVRTRAMDERDDLAIPARAARIASQEGLGALFAGVSPRLLRALLSGGLQFGSYEFTKRFFAAAN